jgi:threonine aldolase
MNFVSDNTGGVHPRIVDALVAANTGNAPSYGADDLTQAALHRLREVFEAPEAQVFLVSTGTAANALALASIARPWQAIFCSDRAHIHHDECNAAEFYTGGAKLRLLPTTDARITPETLETAIAATSGPDYPDTQRGPVALTQLTEAGTAYTLDHLSTLAQIAHAHGLPVFLDGARFANALAALGCSPAEMSWKAGIDALSFGATKNGAMGAEAVIIFDPKHATETDLRRVRGGHRLSKHRFLAAQMLAYLEDDLWLDMARHANAMGQRLVKGLGALPGVTLDHSPDANMVFAHFTRAIHRRLVAANARYGLEPVDLDGPEDQMIGTRLVAGWHTTETEVDTFLSIMSG